MSDATRVSRIGNNCRATAKVYKKRVKGLKYLAHADDTQDGTITKDTASRIWCNIASLFLVNTIKSQIILSYIFIWSNQCNCMHRL